MNVKKNHYQLTTYTVKYTDSSYIVFKVMNIITNGNSNLIISVKDTGRGIKSDHIKLLFNNFQRVDEDKNNTIEGTGLGLAIIKQLVKINLKKIFLYQIK